MEVCDFDTSPTDFGTSPTDFDTSSTDFDTSPTDFDKSPTNFDTSPTDFDKSPTDFDTSPTDFNGVENRKYPALKSHLSDTRMKGKLRLTFEINSEKEPYTYFVAYQNTNPEDNITKKKMETLS